MAGIAQFSLVALDCPDPDALADFYGRITGWQTGPANHDDWVQLRSDAGATIAFQRVSEFEPPDWPDGEPAQQAHLDFDVLDLDEGEARVLAIGARKTDVQPDPDDFRVFLDPAGHPFCLVLADT